MRLPQKSSAAFNSKKPDTDDVTDKPDDDEKHQTCVHVT